MFRLITCTSRTMKAIVACALLLVVVLATVYAAPNDCNIRNCLIIPVKPVCGKRVNTVNIPKWKIFRTFYNDCMLNFANCSDEIRYEKVFNGTCSAYKKSLTTTVQPIIETTTTTP